MFIVKDTKVGNQLTAEVRAIPVTPSGSLHAAIAFGAILSEEAEAGFIMARLAQCHLQLEGLCPLGIRAQYPDLDVRVGPRRRKRCGRRERDGVFEGEVQAN